MTPPPSPPSLLKPLKDPFYPDPPWCHLPSPHQEWSLTEIKSGVEVARYALHQRPCWLLGRAADQVHIPLQHESCSRCHARIAFDGNGTPWLRDCNSSHGTFVNKKRLPPEAVGTTDSVESTKRGARGVVLFPGDLLSFGASTRIFCLEGPPEFEREAIQLAAINKKQAAAAIRGKVPLPTSHSQQAKQKSINEQQDAGVSWGISMDDDNDDQAVNAQQCQEDKTQQMAVFLENSGNIPDKHRKAWEKIQALKYKLQNVQTESERIRRKGELTEGQERQLHKNSEREQQLQENILDREQELHDKLHPDNNIPRRKRSHRHHDDDDDDADDDAEFFDKTKQRNLDGETAQEETEESLLAKWKDLQLQQGKIELVAMRAKQIVEETQQRLKRLQAAGDDEAFFVENDLKLAQEQYTKIHEEEQRIVNEKADTKKLLFIVNSTIRLDGENDGQQPSNGAASFSMGPPNAGRGVVVSSVEATAAGDGDAVMPPPPSKSTAISKDEPHLSTTSSPVSNEDFSMPPPKRKQTVGPALPPPHPLAGSPSGGHREDKGDNAEVVVPTTSATGKSNKRKRPSNPPQPMGTLAALAAVTGGPAAAPPFKKSRKNLKEAQSTTKRNTDIDLQKDEWHAPEDQDGSGFTKLNAKFAGRY